MLDASTQARSQALIIGPSSTIGAVMPPSRRPPTNVVDSPMVVRRSGAQPFAPRGSAACAGHLVVGPVWLLRADLRFVDDHQPPRVEVRLGVELGLTASQHVRPILFDGVRRFFQL